MQTVRNITSVSIFLAVWEITSRIWQVRTALCPPPSQCMLALVSWAQHDGLWTDLLASSARLAAGVMSGSFFGIVFGLLTGRSRPFELLLLPLIRLFRPLPPVALVPLFIVWFGIGENAKVFAIAFAVFFPVWLNTFSSARQIPQRLLWSAKTLTQSKVKVLWRVVIPASLPGVITGLRLGIATGFVMVFVSELMGTDVGIGYKISIWQLAYRMDAMIAALAILGGLGALGDWAFVHLMYIRFPWLRFIERPPNESSVPDLKASINTSGLPIKPSRVQAGMMK